MYIQDKFLDFLQDLTTARALSTSERTVLRCHLGWILPVSTFCVLALCSCGVAAVVCSGFDGCIVFNVGYGQVQGNEGPRFFD